MGVFESFSRIEEASKCHDQGQKGYFKKKKKVIVTCSSS
ncbi:hypothetical protein BRARA_F02920 [Brassica rapa]|uniref:Uncharacterized protein n=1 Tax=Brassica campestris TaxID=3711 RepID=A0A397Z953_BRACM|nr:hypothetical protein BRARA_F02920 [Brassica rapa]